MKKRLFFKEASKDGLIIEICKEMGISKFRDKRKYTLNSDQTGKINEFHLAIKKYYNGNTGIEEE